jgi:hypothetical protein
VSSSALPSAYICMYIYIYTHVCKYICIYIVSSSAFPSAQAAKEAYSEENETSLADGEFAVYNQDGDEALQWWPWELSSGSPHTLVAQGLVH